MDPRYQIFVSSTFRDLGLERQAVLDAILELGHFPAGMEVFPAANATPWSLIEAIIGESDYYVLIIGGLYGSTDESGISYTEKEYDLALNCKIPVLAFLHRNPAEIPMGKSELDPAARQRLSEFRRKVEHHHCKYWSSSEDLKAKVLASIVHEIRVNPRTGWIRGDSGDSPETLKKFTLVLEENVHLRSEIKFLHDSLAVYTNITDLSCGSETIEIGFQSSQHSMWTVSLTWDLLFKLLGRILLCDQSERDLFRFLSVPIAKIAAETNGSRDLTFAGCDQARITDDDAFRIIYQFMALGYIEPITLPENRQIDGQMEMCRSRGYRLTKVGSQALGRLVAVRRNLDYEGRC
jgi:hypothetical protein